MHLGPWCTMEFTSPALSSKYRGKRRPTGEGRHTGLGHHTHSVVVTYLASDVDLIYEPPAGPATGMGIVIDNTIFGKNAAAREQHYNYT